MVTKARIRLAAVWVAGLVGVWWAMPFGPRDGWQPPTDEFIIGFIDEKTLLTIPRSPTGSRVLGTPETGPIHLWNVDTGRLLASHFGRDDVFVNVLPEYGTGLLRIQQRKALEGDDQHVFVLRLVDAWTGAEKARFTCRVPKDNVWWMLSPDLRTTAFVTYDGEKPIVEWFDVATGARLHAIEGFGEPIRFSPDGEFLVATKVDHRVPEGLFLTAMRIWDVATGREVATFRHPNPTGDVFPKEFTGDGQLLLDSHCNVWDLATERVRFRVPDIYYGSSLFSPDGKDLIVVAKNAAESWLAYYDLATGKEREDRRVPLAKGAHPGMHLGPATQDRRLLVASGSPDSRAPSKTAQWLARVPGLERLGRHQMVDGFVLVETATGRELMRGGDIDAMPTPDAEHLIRTNRENHSEIWNLPPRRPWRWLIPAWGAWSLLIGLFATWRWRRRRAAATGT